MPFDRNLFPGPPDYYEAQGLRLTGPRSAKWKTAACAFHGGSDSLRVNVVTGAYVCMAGCGASGGDVLAYEIAMTGADFVAAAKAIGAWVDDGRPYSAPKPTPLSPRSALSAMGFEATLVAVAAGNLAQGIVLSDADKSRLTLAAGRINRMVEVFQ